MVSLTTVTIKARRERGGLIEWNYDHPRQCQRFWLELCRSGRAPDTGDSLASAVMFIGPHTTPDKVWEKPNPANVTNLSLAEVGI